MFNEFCIAWSAVSASTVPTTHSSEDQKYLNNGTVAEPVIDAPVRVPPNEIRDEMPRLCHVAIESHTRTIGIPWLTVIEGDGPQIGIIGVGIG